MGEHKKQHEVLTVTFWFNGEKHEYPAERIAANGIIPGTESQFRQGVPFIDVKEPDSENVIRYINYDNCRQVMKMGPPPVIDVVKDMPRVKLS